MALRVLFISDNGGEDKKRLAQSKEKRSTRQTPVMRSPVSAGTTAFDISATPEAPATYIRDVEPHLITIPLCYRRLCSLFGYEGSGEALFVLWAELTCLVTLGIKPLTANTGRSRRSYDKMSWRPRSYGQTPTAGLRVLHYSLSSSFVV